MELAIQIISEILIGFLIGSLIGILISLAFISIAHKLKLPEKLLRWLDR